MPFTAPLLSVATSDFDCLCEHTGSYTIASGLGSAQFKRYSTDGNFNVLRDPKNIITQIYNTGTADTIRLNGAGTLKLTLISNYTYSSTDSSDKAGFSEVGLASDGGFSPGGVMPDYTTFDGTNPVTITDQTLSASASIPGLIFKCYRATTGNSFSASGRLLFGINKT